MKQVTVAEGNRRLLKLAAFLRTLPRRRFNYGHWVGDDWAGAQDLSCGTTACALGWAATMPTFRRLGLSLTPVGEPGLKGVAGGAFDAAAQLFGLHGEQYSLFAPDYEEEDATPKQVARKIEQFVAARE
jgi:hypothetical protein